MAGWSQGAQVVHKAATLVGATQMASVGAVVTFGDPGSSQIPQELSEILVCTSHVLDVTLTVA